MGNVVLVGERTGDLEKFRVVLSKHLPQAQIIALTPEEVLRSLFLFHTKLIVYCLPQEREIDKSVIGDIKSVLGDAPLLIYGHFGSMSRNLAELLDQGVHGLLSATSTDSEHINAINALLRGTSYIDLGVKLNALRTLLRR